MARTGDWTGSTTNDSAGGGRRRRFAATAGGLAAILGLSLALAPGASATGPDAATAATANSTAISYPAQGGIPTGVVTPRLAWGACGPGLEPFRCATVQVPTDYDQPRGASTSIALMMLPAAQPGQRIGSLFTNPGGPGGSGIDFVAAAPILYTPEVRARYDIVGFDPRGVARSDPATCYRTAAAEQHDPLFRMPYPLTKAQGRAYVDDSVAFAKQCTSTSPNRFRHASTANVARDLEMLRRGVGDTTLTYAGYSYGTFLGATYARLFPDKVGRFVLDGTVDPKAWTGTGTGDAASWVPLGIRIRQGTAASETFEQFGRTCRQAGPTRCSLAALGDPETVAERLFDRLARHPVTVPTPSGPLVIDQQLAVAITFQSLYDPAGWASLADLLAALAQGEPEASVAAALARTPSTVGQRLRSDAPERRGEDYASAGGLYASLCVDARPSGLLGSYQQIATSYDRTAPYFGRYRAWVGSVCERWPVTDSDVYRGPWAQTTKAKVLVIGTRYDPATPYSQTKPYAALYPRASVLTVQGYGHTALGKSACADRAVTRYLLNGATPDAGATCRQDSAPFSPATERATEAAKVLPRLVGSIGL